MIVGIMKQKLGFFAGIIGIIVLVIGGIKLWSNRTPKQGVLKVNSIPTASIFLDNKHIGRSPLDDKVNAGDYTIKISPESAVSSLASWQGTIKISSGLLTYVNANLAESEFLAAIDTVWLEKISSKRTELSVTTNPDGATVTMDGDVKGITPLSTEINVSGDHTLTVTSPGFLPRTLKIVATPGFKIIASMKLALSGEPSQPVEASASPTPTGSVKATPTPKSSKAATSSASTLPAQAGLSDPPKPFVRIKDTPTGFLRVRMEPATTATEAGRVNPGEKYHIEDEQSSWYQIKYDGTNTGWISGAYAEKTE